MQKKIIGFLQTELASAVFFCIVGIFLSFLPVQTVDVICKGVFGILLIITGLYNIFMYLSEKTETTVLNMLSGVIILVLGIFLFGNPQIVVRLLPQLLGSLVLIDSIWLLRISLKIKKMENDKWTIFLIAGLVCVILGIIIVVNPFSKVKQTVVFSGIVFLINGIGDIVLYIVNPKKKDQDPGNGNIGGEETSLVTEEAPSMWADPRDPQGPGEFYSEEDHLEEWQD